MELDGTETVLDLLLAGQIRAGIDGSEKCARLALEYAGEESAVENDSSADLLKAIGKAAKQLWDEQDGTE